jgi:apolipoprotein D and lipocalin family protein
MLSLTIVVAVLSLASLSSAKECPKIVTQNPFDITQYVGFWYEVYRSDIIFEVGSRCVNATYTPNADGTVGVWNQAVNFMGDYTSIRGSAKVKNASEPAAFIVTFDNPVRKGDYNVITSNYVDYALVYACQNIPVIDRELQFIWILSRTKSLSQAVVDELKKTLTDMGADIGSLMKTEQNC